MSTNLEKTPKEHIETVITEQSLSIASLKKMKNRIVSARTFTKEQRDKLKKKNQRLEKKLEQITGDLNVRQKGFSYLLKDFAKTLKSVFLPVEIFVAIFSIWGPILTEMSYVGFFLGMNALCIVYLGIVSISYGKKIYGKKESEYQQQIRDLSAKLEDSKQHQKKLEAKLDIQLSEVIQYLNEIFYQESAYYENIAKRNAKLREERKKLLADVTPTVSKQYVKIK